jgi:hypothetical protein
MLIWLFLLIPLIGSIYVFFNNRESVTRTEALIPFIVCFIAIAFVKLIVEKTQVDDTEYLGANLVEARYYEYWETYVHRTCSRTVSCGKNCTTVIYYDCSYCDENPEYWEVIDSEGNRYHVSGEYYNFLIKKWKAKPQFVELNRSIDNTMTCGKDGDMYRIFWNKDPMTSESSTWDNTYENRIKAANSSFDFVKVTEEDKVKYGIFEYPEINGIKQTTSLGLEKAQWLGKDKIAEFHQISDYLNGYLGPMKQARIYFLFFVDKPPMASNFQQAYWQGGNGNEVVVCIGLSKGSDQIKWVRPFSWSTNRKIIPEIREDIMGSPKFDPQGIRRIVFKDVLQYYRRRDFKEFSYVTVDPPTWSYVLVFILTSIITVLVCKFIIDNEIEP